MSRYWYNEDAAKTAAALVGMVALIAVTGLLLVNFLTATHYKGVGTVTNRHYSPGYWMTTTSESCSGSGKNRVCVPVVSRTYIPPAWRVCVKVDDQNPCGDVSEGEYNAIVIGQRVRAYYDKGGVLGNYYLTSLQPV